jgi:fucose 4-O-acetylase-like acetyltransferase
MRASLNHLYYPKTSTQQGDDNKRDYYIDNLKYLLIVLVVIGHVGFKLPNIRELKGLVYFVYVFHMPCFVFTNGYLAKSMNKGGKLRIDKIFAVFWMYLIFKGGNVLLGHIFDQKVELNLLLDGSAPWYLLTLCIWYLCIPLIERIKTSYLILGSLSIGILIGYTSYIKNVMSLSRVFVFFPFFIIGFKLSKDQLNKFLNRRIRLLALALFGIAFLIFFKYWDYFGSAYKIIYGGTPYSELLGASAKYGFIVRGAWYVIAIVMSALFMLLVPRGKVFFTRFGERTMQIYISHIWLRYVLIQVGFFTAIKNEPTYTYYLVLLSCVIATLLLSNKLLKILFDKLVPNSLFQRIINKD